MQQKPVDRLSYSFLKFVLSVTPTFPVGSVLCPTSVTAAKWCMLVWRSLPNQMWGSFCSTFWSSWWKLIYKFTTFSFGAFEQRRLWQVCWFSTNSTDFDWMICVLVVIDVKSSAELVKSPALKLWWHRLMCINARPWWILENNLIKQKLNFILV